MKRQETVLLPVQSNMGITGTAIKISTAGEGAIRPRPGTLAV